MIFDNNDCLYAHIRGALRIGGKIIINTNDEFLLYFESGDFCIYETKKIEYENLVDFVIENNVSRIETTDINVFKYMNKMFKNKNKQVCIQGAKKNNEKVKFELLKPYDKDIDLILSKYDITKEQLIDRIENDAFFVYYDDDIMVGFAGIHIDGSIGFLYVDTKYRRKGFAQFISKNIASIVDSDEVFVQIETENIASINLHKKLGYNFAENYIYWLFDIPF